MRTLTDKELERLAILSSNELQYFSYGNTLDEMKKLNSYNEEQLANERAFYPAKAKGNNPVNHLRVMNAVFDLVCSERNKPEPYIMRRCRHVFIEVNGYIWQPGIGICYYLHEFTDHELEQLIGLPYTRETFMDWANAHMGDFQDITDIRVEIGNWELDWENPDKVVLPSDGMEFEEDEYEMRDES